MGSLIGGEGTAKRVCGGNGAVGTTTDMHAWVLLTRKGESGEGGLR